MNVSIPLAKEYHVPLNADGQPNPEAVQQAAHFVVMVRIHLSGGPTALSSATSPVQRRCPMSGESERSRL